MKMAARVALRYAGLFQAPPKMVESILSQNKMWLNVPTTFQVTVDLRDWRYAPKIHTHPESINVKIVEGYDSLGGFTPEHNLITLEAPWLRDPREVRETVNHELEHFGQSLLRKNLNQSTLRERKPGAGFVSRKNQSKDVSQGSLDARYSPDALYVLDDAEFYPLLRDEITRLKKHIEKVLHHQGEDYTVRKDLTRMFEGFIGKFHSQNTSRFFSLLKTNAPGKYHKTVTEAYKSIQHYIEAAPLTVEF